MARKGAARSDCRSRERTKKGVVKSGTGWLVVRIQERRTANLQKLTRILGSGPRGENSKMSAKGDLLLSFKKKGLC